jgi:hypothetical protein
MDSSMPSVADYFRVEGQPAEHFHADHALRQSIQLARQGMFHHQPKKVLAAFASGEGVTRNHCLQRTAYAKQPCSGLSLSAFSDCCPDGMDGQYYCLTCLNGCWKLPHNLHINSTLDA